MGPTKLRDKACRLAATDLTAAVACAEQIDDSWYACQAFAWCGRFALPGRAERLIDQAFRHAAAGKDDYHCVAAVAWPLRALIELEQFERAVREFNRIVTLGSKIEHPGGRAEACALVFHAAATAGGELGQRALRWVVAACQPIEHWRQERALGESIIRAVTIALLDRAAALNLVQDELVREKLSAQLERGKTLRPRDFFWT